MAKLKGKAKNIAYSVSFKGALDLVAGGIVELDTEDIGAELADLADMLFEHYQERLDAEASGGGGSRGKGRSSGGRSGGSNKRGSNRSGSGSRKPSGKQLHFFYDLVKSKDHEYDYELDDDEEEVVEFDGKDVAKYSGKQISDLIEELLDEDDL